MQNNPRKSKALIITFVIVFGLLIGLYFVFTSDTLFGVNNSVGKKFSPFLITPKEKGLNQIEDPNAVSTNNPTNTDTGNPDTDPNLDGRVVDLGNGFSGNVGGVGTGIYTNPAGGSVALPGGRGTVTPSNFIAQCKDGKDNDGDSLIDAADPGCHTDGDATNTKSYNKDQYLEYNFIPACSDGVDNDKDKLIDDKDPGCHSDNNAKNTATYTPNYISEATNQLANKSTAGECTMDDLPLIFTAEEQAQLDELTRQFYRLAPVLKSKDDVLAENKTTQSYKDMIENAKDLTNECYDQTYNTKYLAKSAVLVTEDYTFPIDVNIYKETFKRGDGKTPTSLLMIDLSKMVCPPTNTPSSNGYGRQSNWGNTNSTGGAQPGTVGVRRVTSVTPTEKYCLQTMGWASLSGPDAEGRGDKGRTERRGNPYLNDTKPYSSYYQVYRNDASTGNTTYYPWADWEDLLGIW